MNLIPLPAFNDNYFWLLHDGAHAIVVDPGEAQVVINALQRFDLKLDAILVTHHQADHVGGVQALRPAAGTPAQMLVSLAKLSALPSDTLVCCAHEYTLANLKFTNEVEPDNTNLVNYTAHCQTLRAMNLPTLPSTVGLERQMNPFLRSRERSVRQSIQVHAAHSSILDDAQAFAILREWKNKFQ